MKKIIREKYENGVLVSRDVEVIGSRLPKLSKLVIHLVVALSLAVIAIVITHDSLTAGALDAADITGTSCQTPAVRS